MSEECNNSVIFKLGERISELHLGDLFVVCAFAQLAILSLLEYELVQVHELDTLADFVMEFFVYVVDQLSDLVYLFSVRC